MTGTGDTRILDPRVELIAGAIHRLIERYPATLIGHDGMYDLAVASLEALQGGDYLRDPFAAAYVEPSMAQRRRSDQINAVIDALVRSDAPVVYEIVDRMIWAGDAPEQIIRNIMCQLEERSGGVDNKFAKITRDAMNEIQTWSAPRLALELACARMMLRGAGLTEASESS